MDRDSDQVFSQCGELNDYNLFSSHSALVAVCAREGDHDVLVACCYAPQSP
jgi:hypothetical protein